MLHRKVNHKASGSLIANAFGAATARHAAGRVVSAAVAVISSALLLAAPAAAAPWWVAWEGNDSPENEGRERMISNEPSKRVIEDGIMTIDGMDTGGGWDAYRRSLEADLDPAPGELFILRWRLRIDAVEGASYDPAVSIATHDAWRATFFFARSRVWSLRENVLINFTPGEFHAWELRSWNMRQYELRLDGEIVRQGQFVRVPGSASYLDWGDWGGFPGRSRSAWDYVRFGVVPEVETRGLVVILGLMAARVRRL